MSNSMLDILQNFDAAEKGEKTSATADAGSMKSILEAFHGASTKEAVSESVEAVEECGMPMQSSMPEQHEGNPVTMNVSLTASGKEHVDDLIALMKLAGAPASDNAPVKPVPSGAAFDIDRDGADDMEIQLPAKDQEMDMATMRQIMAAGDKDESVEEEWDNAPDEEYKDDNYMTQDLAGGLNRAKPKGSERVKDPAVESIKDQLWAALNEKKTVEGDYANDAQRKAVHAAKAEKKKKK